MNFLEWYLRLPARPESEDVGWSVVLERARPTGVVEWGIAAAILALATISLVSYFRQSRELPARLRLTLLTLRLAAVVLIGLLLAGLGLTAQSVGRPKLVLMLDVSASMSTPDIERPDDDDEDSSEHVDRLTMAIDRLLADDARILHDLASRYRVRIYEFGGDALPVASIDTPEDIETAIVRLGSLEPSASATRPAASVETVLRDLRGQSIAAIVAITDGVSSTGVEDSWTAAADSLVESQVPLAAVPMGAETPPFDVQIVEAHLPESAWVGQPVSFLVQVRCLGADGRDVVVELREAATGRLINTANIAVEGNDVREWLSLSLTPDEAGEFEYQASVAELDDELVTHNNAVTRSLEVRQGQIRVLLVERVPRWEYRHLKAILERDELVDLDTVLTWADAGYVQEDTTALPNFPSTREELLGQVDAAIALDDPAAQPELEPLEAVVGPSEEAAGYDVIIWGDVDPDSLVPDALTFVLDFVRLKGGGLVLIAGTQHNPWSYLESPLAPLLPFPSEGFNVPRPVEGISGFRQERTIDGQSFGFLRFDNDAEQDAAIWESLPLQHWLLPIDRLKAGAQALAAHPTLQGSSGPAPTVIYQRYGAGQVIYLATDEFWQWRAGVEDQYLGRFWSQMIRAITTPSTSGGGEGTQLVSLQPVYAEGEPVAFRAEFPGGNHLPGSGQGEVVIERDAIVTQRVALTRSAQRPNSLEGAGTPLPAGTYRAWLADPSIPGELPSCRFEVDPGHRELLATVVNRAELASAAEQTGGMLVEFEDLSRLARQLPAGRRVPTSEITHIPLWSRPEPLLLLTLLLGCEWSLRRKHRLT